MSMNTGITVSCDNPGCTSSSDDFPSCRGFRRYNVQGLEAALLINGWWVVKHRRRDQFDELETSYFCPEHAVK